MRKLFALALLATFPVAAAQAQGQWTTVKGRIVWDDAKGAPPERKPVVATKDQQVCAQDKDFNTEDWVISPKTKGIKNVVVWLAPEFGPAEQQAVAAKKLREVPSFKPANIHPDLAKPAQPTVEIDQPCCRFIPHIVLAREGQNMLIKNSAPVPHNAKWVSRNNGEINPLIPAGGQHVVNGLKSERFPISVECSIHPWMKAYVRVFDHPYFALTDDDGNFEIKDAPVMGGKLRLFIWQETGGFQGGNDGRFGQSIDVKPGTVDLQEIKYAGKS